ncbi:hypothetical protein AAVH_35195 [Aphelenchoides avenae]|nr:hypothetical protein AAVH_35195 [Aphelenchus avenae]
MLRRILCVLLVVHFAGGFRSGFGPYGSGGGGNGRGVRRPWEANYGGGRGVSGRHVNIARGIGEDQRTRGTGRGQGQGGGGVLRPKPVNPAKPWESGLSKGVVGCES